MKQRESELIFYLRRASSRLFPYSVVKILLFFYEKYKRIRMPEKKCSFGELYPDRTFYVIRFYPPGTGYLALYVYILGYMKYAYENGWIPVIDLKHYQNMYNDFNESGMGEDIWGWFFEQPWDQIHNRRYSLEEVYKSKNVILSCGSENFHDASLESTVVEWQREMAKLVPFTQGMQKHVDREYERIKKIKFESKVIGIGVRETDLQKHVAGHAIQMSKEDGVKKYNECKKKWYTNTDSVTAFINAEEQASIAYMVKEIPNAIFTNTKRVDNYKGGNAAYTNREEGPRIKLQDYLTNMYLLSKCDSLIGSMNNGIYVAYLWSDGKLDHFEKVDLGRYK